MRTASILALALTCINSSQTLAFTTPFSSTATSTSTTASLINQHGIEKLRSSTSINHQSDKYAHSSMKTLQHASTMEEQEPSVEEMDTSQIPQAIGTGFSSNTDLFLAIEEATSIALDSLPPSSTSPNIDLSMVYVSSIYDGQYPPSKIVPAILDQCKKANKSIQKLVGCSAGGLIGSKPSASSSGNTNPCTPMETEGVAGVTVTLCVLPDTQIQSFHLTEDDVPEMDPKMSKADWKNFAGMRHFELEDDQETAAGADADPYSFMLLPAPSFQKDLDEFLRGLSSTFGPSATIFGALSSTVSSLSRSKLFRYDIDRPDSIETLTEGCIGVGMRGDARWKIMVAQGAKPVGGVYRIVAGSESTIGAIQLDAVATEQLEISEEGLDNDEDDDDEDEDDLEGETDKKKIMAAAYAKAIIPKPVLAEANYLMKTLSDDDQAFMRKFILVGLERSGGIGKSPSEIIRLAEGMGHRFTVHQVASAGMKDGSVTLPLGSVDVELGTRMRFFVRDGDFAKKEVEAIWTGYKKKELEGMFAASDDGSEGAKSFIPSGCLVFPTLDRGQKLFGGKAGFESAAIAEFAPNVPSISGFFSNGVIAALGGNDKKNDEQVMVHGSASCYALVGSKSGRPVYSAARALEEKRAKEEKAREEEEAKRAAKAKDEKRTDRAKGVADAGAAGAGTDEDVPAPRSEDGELVIKRREIHSGRALTVSAVQWSVAEKMAKPTSALEGYMWEKETEVDRLRERVPLSNLVSQCKLFDLDPSKPKPRDWISPIRAAAEDSFVIIPELKRVEPMTGSLRKRYDIQKLSKQFVQSGAAAMSINSDQVLFGGSLEDITESREATSKAILESSSAEEGVVAPPILASDLILYPYQLYKLRLAGADAVNLIVGALTNKDLLYLSKIAASLKMSVVASVTSEVQIGAIAKIGSGICAISVSNRDLETFTFDDTGAQALDLLKSDAMKEYREKHPDVMIFAEGRVGMVEMEGKDGKPLSDVYVQALRDAGAMGAFVGSGLADAKDVPSISKFLGSFNS